MSRVYEEQSLLLAAVHFLGSHYLSLDGVRSQGADGGPVGSSLMARGELVGLEKAEQSERKQRVCGRGLVHSGRTDYELGDRDRSSLLGSPDHFLSEQNSKVKGDRL